jgi:hypothetical protein
MTAAFAFLRPFVILAAFAFVAGFFGYLAMGRPSQAMAAISGDITAQPAAASGPASEDWNLPHHI